MGDNSLFLCLKKTPGCMVFIALGELLAKDPIAS